MFRKTHFLSPSSARFSRKGRLSQQSSPLSEYESTLDKFYTTSSNAVRKRAVEDLANLDQSAKSSLSGASTPVHPLSGQFWPSYSKFTHSLTSFPDWTPRLFDGPSSDVSLPKNYRTDDRRMDEILEQFVRKGKDAKTKEEQNEVIREVENFWPAEKRRSTAFRSDTRSSPNDTTKRKRRNHGKLHKAKTLWEILTRSSESI